MQNYKVPSANLEETISIGKRIGAKLRGGEVFELVSDLGGGKTSFVSGVSQGFGSIDPVSSPSFTISYIYGRADGKALHHFDFYRLEDAGVVGNELAEVAGDESIVVAVEWGEIVHDVLPAERVTVQISSPSTDSREFTFSYPEKYQYLFGTLSKDEQTL